MAFLVAGASCFQIGTANYYDPTISQRMVEELPAAVRSLGASSLAEIVGSLEANQGEDAGSNDNACILSNPED